jgi:hypothetical protein
MTDWALDTSDAPGSRRYGAERVAEYDSAIEVPLVLADANADRTRRVLRDAGRDPARIEGSRRVALGVPVRLAAPPPVRARSCRE